MALHGQGVAEGGARPLSLTEAIRLARLNSPLTIAARGQVRSSDAATRSAFGTFLPTLSINAGGTRSSGSNTNPGGGLDRIQFPWNFSRGLQSNIEIFDGGRRWYNYRSAQANQGAAEFNQRLQDYRVALEVKQQFFNILAARESRAAAEAQVAQAQEQLKAANARLAAGAATKSDSLRSIIAVGNGQLAVLQADNNLRVANANLTRLVGTTFQVTADANELEAIPTVAIDSAQLLRWVEESPTVASARSQIRASQSAIRAAKTPYMPTFSLGFGLSGNRPATGFEPIAGEYGGQNSLRLTLNYPIFNGLQREENITRADVALDNAQAQLRDARLTTEQQLTTLLGSLRLAEARIAIQLASVEAGEEDLRVQNQRYSLGASTLLDVLTSQSTLNQSRFSLIQARYEARSARAQIEALVGRDLP
ncbi:MAG: TolC family protein [Cytophagaceae bacterium]|nr:TolC family protein [Gemmatimonadaceae bacterium]